MFLSYDSRNYDIEAIEYPESWRVQYTLKCRECNSGDLYVLVNKKNRRSNSSVSRKIVCEFSIFLSEYKYQNG